MQVGAALFVDEPGGVEQEWKNFEKCLFKEAVDVCGETKCIRRHKCVVHLHLHLQGVLVVK